MSVGIIRLVREHTYYDGADNSDTAKPYRSVAPDVAWVAVLWPQIFDVHIVSVESCHDDTSSFEYPQLLQTPHVANAPCRDGFPRCLRRQTNFVGTFRRVAHFIG